MSAVKSFIGVMHMKRMERVSWTTFTVRHLGRGVETEPRLVPYMFISERFRHLDAILIRMSHSQMLHSYQNGV